MFLGLWMCWKAIIAPYRAIVNFRNYFRAVESPPPCGRRRTGRYNGVLLSHQNLNVLVVNSGLRSLGSITPKRAESDSETLNTMSRMTRKTLVPGDRYWRFWTRPRHGLDWGIDGWQQQYFEEMQHQTAAGEKLFFDIFNLSSSIVFSLLCLVLRFKIANIQFCEQSTNTSVAWLTSFVNCRIVFPSTGHFLVNFYWYRSNDHHYLVNFCPTF